MAERKPLEIKKKPVVTCSTFNEVTFSEGLLGVTGSFQYKVSQAEVDTLTIKVPRILELLYVTGPSGKKLKTWNRNNEEVTVYLPSQRKGIITIKAYGQAFLLHEMKATGSAKELDVTLPFMTALNTISPSCLLVFDWGKAFLPILAKAIISPTLLP